VLHRIACAKWGVISEKRRRPTGFFFPAVQSETDALVFPSLFPDEVMENQVTEIKRNHLLIKHCLKTLSVAKVTQFWQWMNEYV
jgi:hypothetical protein